jgi:N6-adenosine-specific RNA methylase IME4
MTTDDIKAIPVSDIALPDAHLWLWTTNPHLPEALEVVKAWGFEYKTLLTWAKNRMGTGWWLRSKTEHLIFAAHSKKLRKNPGNITTLVQAAYEGHSVKPQCFYDIIERLSPEPRVALFSRHPRSGWTTLISDASASDVYGDSR